MKPAKRILLSALLVFIGAYSMGVSSSWAYNFTVNSTADAVDANPGDTFCETAPGNGICTLRAAIQEANSFPIEHNITLPTGTYILSLGELTITENISIYGAGQGEGDTVINGNNASRIFKITEGVPLTLNNLKLRSGAHTADGPKTGGGAIFNQGTLIALNMTLAGNQGTGAAGDVSYGGGIFNDGTMTLDYCTFINNQAGQGGGLFNNGTADIANVSFDSNSAGSGNGGGIYNSGFLTLEKSTINGSTAGLGGGIFNDGIMNLTNATLSGNSVPGPGGGIHNGTQNSGSQATLINVTVSDNSAANGGGIFNNTGNTVNLKNTIVANSTGGNCSGTITSNGHNLEDADSCNLSTILDDLIGINPDLDPLSKSDLQTSWPTLTQKLNQAIAKNVATGCPTTDQRGYPRDTPLCDIGAYEDTDGNPFPAITTLVPNNSAAGGGDLTLTVNGYTYFSSGGGSVVRWNGNDRQTTVVGPLQLTALIPQADLAAAGKALVTVFNPGPGGGLSNEVTFTITSANPKPIVTQITPAAGRAGQPVALTVNGSNFLGDSLSVVLWNGIARPTAFVSPSQLTADIPATDLAAMGTASVTVSNSPPGGGISDPPVPFTIGPPNLYLPLILRN
jgi:CSLREA domain-containing protein